MNKLSPINHDTESNNEAVLASLDLDSLDLTTRNILNRVHPYHLRSVIKHVVELEHESPRCTIGASRFIVESTAYMRDAETADSFFNQLSI